MVNMPAYAVPLPPPAPLPVSFGSEPPPMARTRLAPDALPDWMFEDEYQEEAINHMITLEAATAPSVAMIDAQPQCGWDMRRYLVDMLIEVHGVGAETVLHHTVNIVDRYMSKRVVLRKHYQLLTCCALLLASKYDNAKAPRLSLKQCRELCQDAFDDKVFVQMTHHILHALGWSIGQPQVSDWIVFKCATLQEPEEVEHVAQYLAQVSLYHRAFVGLPSACLAAAVHLMARAICGIHNSTSATASTSSGVADTAADMLDRLVTDHFSDVSPLLNQKFDSPLRGMATRLVQQHASNRLLQIKLPSLSSPLAPGGLELPFPMSPFGSTALAPTCSRQPSLSAMSMTSSASSSVPATPPVYGITSKEQLSLLKVTIRYPGVCPPTPPLWSSPPTA